VAVLHHQRVSVLFQPVACLAQHLGLFHAQEVRDQRHEAECLQLLAWHDQRAIDKRLERALGFRLIAFSNRCDVLDLRRQSEVGERAKRARLGIAEILDQVAKDELERVIALWTGAQVGDGVSEGDATAAADLTRRPAQKQRLAAGLAVERGALGFAGLRKSWIRFGELGEGRERGVFAEFLKDQFLRARADAPARRKNRLAARRQLLDEREDRVALALEQRFEVVEDEQSLRAAKRIKQQARAFFLDSLGNVITPKLTSEFV